jgi:hypothetical protein
MEYTSDPTDLDVSAISYPPFPLGSCIDPSSDLGYIFNQFSSHSAVYVAVPLKGNEKEKRGLSSCGGLLLALLHHVVEVYQAIPLGGITRKLSCCVY